MKNPGYNTEVILSLAVKLTHIYTVCGLTSSQLCKQSRQTLIKYGAGDGTRTHDVQLGKLI